MAQQVKKKEGWLFGDAASLKVKKDLSGMSMTGR